jgi:hypothetical protein
MRTQRREVGDHHGELIGVLEVDGGDHKQRPVDRRRPVGRVGCPRPLPST